MYALTDILKYEYSKGAMHLIKVQDFRGQISMVTVSIYVYTYIHIYICHINLVLISNAFEDIQFQGFTLS